MVTPAVQAGVLRETTRKPEDGSTHWSCRKMAAVAGGSKSTVQRIWARARVQPHRPKTAARRTSAEFLDSLSAINTKTPAEKDITSCWITCQPTKRRPSETSLKLTRG